MYKTVIKTGDVLSFDLPKKYEMAGWVRERAAAKRLPMSAAVARHLLDVCGEDPGHSERLEREIEKLAAYCRGAEASPDDVDAVCTPDDEARIFDLMDAVGHRDRTRAFVLLETIFASGDPSEDANRVLFSLLRHVRKLEEAWQLPGNDQATAAKQLKVHPVHGQEAARPAQELRPAPLRQGLPGPGGGGARHARARAGHARDGGRREPQRQAGGRAGPGATAGVSETARARTEGRRGRSRARSARHGRSAGVSPPAAASRAPSPQLRCASRRPPARRSNAPRRAARACARRGSSCGRRCSCEGCPWRRPCRCAR